MSENNMKIYELERIYRETFLREFRTAEEIAQFVSELDPHVGVVVVGFVDDVRPCCVLKGSDVNDKSLKLVVRNLLATVGPQGAYALIFVSTDTEAALTVSEEAIAHDLKDMAMTVGLLELDVIKVVRADDTGNKMYKGLDSEGAVNRNASQKIQLKPEKSCEDFTVQLCSSPYDDLYPFLM